jgi:hypothetical protein
VGLASNIFSAPGLMPPTSVNLPNFVAAIIVLAMLMGTTAGVLFNWRSCLEYTIVGLTYVRNIIISCVERPARHETCTDDMPKTLNRGSPFWRSRRPALVEQLDIESAPGEQLQNGLEQS